MPRGDAQDIPQLLVVTANGNSSNSYTLDWLDAFQSTSQVKSRHVDLLQLGVSRRLRQALGEVDAILLLHSATADDLVPLSRIIPVLQDRRIPLGALVGNEINLPWAPLSRKIELLTTLEPTLIGTQLLQDAGEYLYGGVPGTRIASIPHAVDPKVLQFQAPRPNQKLSIGTRSAKYLPILGDVDREQFLASVEMTSKSRGWATDFGYSRFERREWQRFLQTLDATAATEAGSLYTARSDDLVCTILEEARAKSPTPSLRVDGRARALSRRLPWRLRQWVRSSLLPASATDLELLGAMDPVETLETFFSSLQPSPAYMKALSSRHVEAAALGTPQILLEGRYNDVLLPDIHYISVSGDLSNLDEGLDRLEDYGERLDIARRARELVATSHTYEHRITQILNGLLG